MLHFLSRSVLNFIAEHVPFGDARLKVLVVHGEFERLAVRDCLKGDSLYRYILNFSNALTTARAPSL